MSSQYESEIAQNIAALKKCFFGEIRINGIFEGTSYSLEFLTAECSNNLHLMGLLAKWRKNHEYWFPAIFPVTTERTIKWFTKGVIENPHRLLFILKVNSDYIGHLGLNRFNFDLKSCEIDNIVRGEEGYRGIMGHAVLQMMEWGRRHLKLYGYSLQTSSDNIKALKLYNRLGFKEVGRVAMIQKQSADGLEWVEAIEPYNPSNISRYNIKMELNNG
jgi:RimJ/RimL family protein N-acetyltransferase